jgi:hypothetical protein
LRQHLSNESSALDHRRALQNSNLRPSIPQHGHSNREGGQNLDSLCQVRLDQIYTVTGERQTLGHGSQDGTISQTLPQRTNPQPLPPSNSSRRGPPFWSQSSLALERTPTAQPESRLSEHMAASRSTSLATNAECRLATSTPTGNAMSVLV